MEEDQFHTEENYRLRQRVDSMMQEILQLRLEMGKLLELISEMKTEIRQMGENSERNNYQRMVTMVLPGPKSRARRIAPATLIPEDPPTHSPSC